jgi:MFS family permease
VRRYLDLLRTPGVPALVAATTLGRLPYGMHVLALILLLRSEGFGYAEVGLVTGAAGLAVGLTAPALGRLIDRLGQTRVLAATSVACLVANASVVVAALRSGRRSSDRARSACRRQHPAGVPRDADAVAGAGRP